MSHGFHMKGARRAVAAVLLAATAMVLPACYGSTAVKGTPVKELVEAGNPEVLKRTSSPAEKEALAEFSRVTENRTFTEMNGVPEYRLGPLDVLEISSRIGEEVTATVVTVNNLGRISYSFVDDLEVSGLTPSQLDELLTERLSDFIRHPRIDVLVKEFNSKSAMIMGELASLRSITLGDSASGRIYLRGKTTLMDLIALAGGYTVDADIKNVKLIRKGRSYVVNLFDIIEKGDQSLDFVIDDGDVVNVPELPAYGERVYVLGEVASQGVYSLKDAQDLLAAISLAGSFTRLAKEENTLIVRGYERGKEPLVLMADMKALLRQADISQNIPLKDGDLVYVPRMVIGDVNDWITNTMPLLNLLLYPYELDFRYFKRRQLTID